jgi:general secretion pathway protein G
MFRRQRASGFTLAELIITLSLLAILAMSALPLGKMAVKRQNEIELSRALRMMRDAIDAYKALTVAEKIEFDEDTEGYPPTLEDLVKGVEVQDKDAKGQAGRKKTVKFLRRIPKDPMTNSREWGLRSLQDEPSSTSWGGQNVFDIYTKSTEKAPDGTPYSEW